MARIFLVCSSSPSIHRIRQTPIIPSSTGGRLSLSLLFAADFSWGAERRCGSVSDPHRRAAGWVGAMWRSFAPTRATIPPPRRNRMNTGFRATTAARRTSPAQGAIIAAETKASRGCWRNDPRSGAGAKPKTERRTGAEIAEIRSDSVSSRQNRWAAMRRRASG